MALNNKNILFYCTRQNPDDYADFFDNPVVIEVQCSGRVGVGELILALAEGYEKVAVLSCGEKSCLHGFGCIEAKKAMNRARKIANVAGIDTKRLVFIEADDPEFQ